MMPTDTLLSIVIMTSPDTIDPAFVQQMADIWYGKPRLTPPADVRRLTT